MLLQEVKEQVFKLSPTDRRELVMAIIASRQDPPAAAPDRANAIQTVITPQIPASASD